MDTHNLVAFTTEILFLAILASIFGASLTYSARNRTLYLVITLTAALIITLGAHTDVQLVEENFSGIE